MTGDAALQRLAPARNLVLLHVQVDGAVAIYIEGPGLGHIDSVEVTGTSDSVGSCETLNKGIKALPALHLVQGMHCK